jgi:glycosyltransferase involved in cell wall biosynthesis
MQTGNGSAPRVSVIIPVYNQRAYLPYTIVSILKQTLRDLELILVDDGSTDGASDVVDAFARRDSRVRVVHQANAGISAAMNRGLAMARSAYIGRIDGDDLALPERFAMQAAFLDAHPRVGVVGGSMYYTDSENRKRGQRRYPIDRNQLHAGILIDQVIAGPTPLFRRSVLEAAGAWRSEFDFAEDYDLAIRMSEKAELANLPAYVVIYRRHEQQTTTLRRQRQKALAMVARIAARLRRSGLPDPIVPGTVMDASLADWLPISRAEAEALRAQFLKAEAVGHGREPPSPVVAVG